MSNFAIARLGSGDVARMRVALALYAEAFDEPEAYLSRQPDDAYLARLLDDERFIQLVAEEEGRILGALSAYVLPKFEQPRSEIYIYDLAVKAGQRRRGIATALIRGLDPTAAEVGAWVVYVQADLGDEPAIALYESLGAREDVLHFDIAPKPAR